MEESPITLDVVEDAEVRANDDLTVNSRTQKGLGADTEGTLWELTSGLLALKETFDCKLEAMSKQLDASNKTLAAMSKQLDASNKTLAAMSKQLDASNKTLAAMLQDAQGDAATKRRLKETRVAGALSQVHTRFIAFQGRVPGYGLLGQILLSFQCDETHWASDIDIRSSGWRMEKVVSELHLLGVKPHTEEKDGMYGFSYPDE
jgi:hypothetical protein